MTLSPHYANVHTFNNDNNETVLSPAIPDHGTMMGIIFFPCQAAHLQVCKFVQSLF